MLSFLNHVHLIYIWKEYHIVPAMSQLTENGEQLNVLRTG